MVCDVEVRDPGGCFDGGPCKVEDGLVVFPEERSDSFFIKKGESFVNHPGYKVFRVVCEFVVVFFL